MHRQSLSDEWDGAFGGGFCRSVSFLPGLFVTTSISAQSGVVAREIRDRKLFRTIGVAWRRTSARDAEFKVLMRFVRDALEAHFNRVALL